MKKTAFLFATILILATAVPAQQVSFKIQGGWMAVQGDDYNTAISGRLDWLRAASSSFSGQATAFKGGLNAQAEIVTHWGRRFAVGFGGGFYTMGEDFRITGAAAADGADFDSLYRPKLSVIPFCLNFYYKAITTSRLNVQVFAGPVFQIAQFRLNRHTTSSAQALDEIENFTASSPVLGAQIGAGVNVKLHRGIWLVVDGFYRFGKAADLMGNWFFYQTSPSGTVSKSNAEYFGWAYDYSSGGTYPWLGFFDSAGPSGEGFSNIRKAAIDLSGLSFTAGLRIDI